MTRAFSRVQLPVLLFEERAGELSEHHTSADNLDFIQPLTGRAASRLRRLMDGSKTTRPIVTRTYTVNHN
jgi:aminopeptidase-like protein